MEPVKAPAPLVIISSSPYIHCGSTISAAMRDVLLSLLPALAAAVYFFGNLLYRSQKLVPAAVVKCYMEIKTCIVFCKIFKYFYFFLNIFVKS